MNCYYLFFLLKLMLFFIQLFNLMPYITKRFDIDTVLDLYQQWVNLDIRLLLRIPLLTPKTGVSHTAKSHLILKISNKKRPFSRCVSWEKALRRRVLRYSQNRNYLQAVRNEGPCHDFLFLFFFISYCFGLDMQNLLLNSQFKHLFNLGLLANI